jgi:hypothetical protein
MKEFTERTTITFHYCCKYMGECCGRTQQESGDDCRECYIRHTKLKKKVWRKQKPDTPFIPTLCGVNCFDNFACRSEQAPPAAPTKKPFKYKHYGDPSYDPSTAKTDGTR